MKRKSHTLKRTMIVMTLMITLVIGFEPLRAAYGTGLTESEIAMLDASDATRGAEIGEIKEKRGNTFVRVLKAPFKAIGRLFGRGKKDDNKLHRLSEKDVKDFETAQVTRIIDAQSHPTPSTTRESPADPSNEAGLSASDAKQARALNYLNQGRNILQAGYLNDAIAFLSLAASLDPKLKEAHNLLGLVYAQKGMRNLALQSFEKALEGSNDQPEHLNNIGFFLYKEGDYDRAAKYLKRAVKLAPNDQRFWNNLGLVQAQRGKFEEAYKSFARAVGEFDGHLNIATRLERLGHAKEAIQHLEMARALQPNSLDVLARLINLYDITGKQERAEAARSARIELEAQAKGAQK